LSQKQNKTKDNRKKKGGGERKERRKERRKEGRKERKRNQLNYKISKLPKPSYSHHWDNKVFISFEKPTPKLLGVSHSSPVRLSVNLCA